MALNLQNTNLFISAGEARQIPSKAIPQVAFSGRSNVGKSSLINNMLGRKSLARVSSAPGKTITINFYEIDKKMFFADLPGYGFAKRSPQSKAQWSSLTDGYFTQNKNIDLLSLVVQLVDLKVGITDDDAMMLNFLVESEIPFVVVATKTDKLNKTDREKNLAALKDSIYIPKNTPIVPFSVLKNEGRTELWRLISQHTDIQL